MIVKVADVVGRRLQGRMLGQEHFAGLCTKVAGLAPGGIVSLCFSDVEVLTGSWLNAALVPFYGWSGTPQNDLYPVLCSLRKEWLDDLRLVAELSSACFLVTDTAEESPHRAVLIGRLEPTMVRTLDAVLKRGPSTGAELKRASRDDEIGATAWNNRLKELHARRLLRRERQGREQRYFAVVPEVAYDGR